MSKQRLFLNGICISASATPTLCSIETEPAEQAETPKFTKSLSLKVKISPGAKEILEAEIAKASQREMYLLLQLQLYVYEHADETHQEAEWIETWRRFAFNNLLSRETVKKIFKSV